MPSAADECQQFFMVCTVYFLFLPESTLRIIIDLSFRPFGDSINHANLQKSLQNQYTLYISKQSKNDSLEYCDVILAVELYAEL